MKKTVTILIILAVTGGVAFYLKPWRSFGPTRERSPYFLHELNNDLTEKINTLRQRTSRDRQPVIELEKEINHRFEEAVIGLSSDTVPFYRLAMARHIARLPLVRVHNNVHIQNVMNRTGLQSLKLSRGSWLSPQFDRHWEYSNLAGGIRFLEEYKDKTTAPDEVWLMLARGLFALGRPGDLIALAKDQWQASGIKSDRLYGFAPPFLYFSEASDAPYRILTERREETNEQKIVRLCQWLAQASAPPLTESIRLNCTFLEKPLAGVHVMLFREATFDHIKTPSLYQAVYPQLNIETWVMYGKPPMPDDLNDTGKNLTDIRWGVSDSSGPIIFGDLDNGRYKFADIMYSEAIFNDGWTNHIPDKSLAHLSVYVKDKSSTGTIFLRFYRAPIMSSALVTTVSTKLDPQINWTLETPPDWNEDQKIYYRLIIKPAFTAAPLAEEINLWNKNAWIWDTDRLTVNLNDMFKKGLPEGLYRFKVCAIINNVVADETDTCLLAVGNDRILSEASLQELQSVLSDKEKLTAFTQGPAPDMLKWYARIDLLNLLARAKEHEAAKVVVAELLSALPEGHLISAYVMELFPAFVPEEILRKLEKRQEQRPENEQQMEAEPVQKDILLRAAPMPTS